MNEAEEVDRESRLDAATAAYLQEAETGRAPDRATFIARYPDLSDELAEFLDDREQLLRLVGPPDTGRRSPAPRACPHCHARLAQDAAGAACPGCGARFRLDPDLAALPANRRFGRFELNALAGRGGFGAVYKAWDPELHREVAVKLPRAGVLATPKDVEQFLSEARCGMKLHHPGIVRVYETGQADGMFYLVSEFVPGRTLARVLREDWPIPTAAAGLLAAVADALHYAHEQGMVHRDVKPSNILLREDGSPAVTDFGLARLSTGEETLTPDGEAVGTPAYMSPEQARGLPRVDRRADVYGLGVILYQMLTGQPPFIGPAHLLLQQHVHDEPRPPRALNNRLPRDLETVCLKCLRKDPDRRYPTAAALADDLRRFLDHKPVLARRVGRVERLGLWARRNPGLATFVGLAAALLVATTAVSVGWALHAQRQADAIGLALGEARRATAERLLDRGLSEAEQGDVGAGLVAMARSLETAPASADDFARTIRVNLNAWRGRLLALTDSTPAPPGEPLAFSPDGSALWVVDPDERTVRRWVPAFGRYEEPTLFHPKRVTAAAVSPDGRKLATRDVDGIIRLWNLATGEVQWTAAGRVVALAFFPDGRRLLTAGLERRSTVFQTWDVDTGEQSGPAFHQPGWVVCMALGGDGRTLHTTIQPGKVLRRTQLPGDKFEDTVLPVAVAVGAVAVSPDGRHLLTGGSDRLARVYEVGSDRPAAVLRHRAPVSAVAFRPAGRGLLTAAPSDAVRAWEGPDRLERPHPVGHPAKVRMVAFSPDGRRAATAADDSVVRVWEFVDGRMNPIGQRRETSPVATVTFSSDGGLLATSTQQHHGARLWDAATLADRGLLTHPAPVRQVAFSPDGQRGVTVGYDRGVWVWDLATRQPSTRPLEHGQVVSGAAFSPDGRWLLTGSEDGAGRLWDVLTGAPRGGPLRHGAPVRVVAFAPDGRTVLTGGDDGAARLWEANTGARTVPPLEHGYRVDVATFTPDGRTVLTGGRDGTTRLWDADTGWSRGPALPHARRVRAVAVSPDGRWAVTASEDGTARMWAVATGWALGPPLRHDDEVHWLALAPRGQWVVTTGWDHTARVWPAPAAQEGPPELLALWAQILTGTELDETGGVRTLAPTAWQDRRRQVREGGGLPP